LPFLPTRLQEEPFFYTWYVFSPQVVVMEGVGGSDALNRSKELGRGSYGRIFGLLALLFVIGLVGGVVNAILAQLFQPTAVVPTDAGPRFVMRSYGLYVLSQVIQFLINAAVYSYSAVCVTLMYFDLRIRKEGFDLELAARQHAGEEKPEGGLAGQEPGPS
jgi:hypothetical protein